jgi:hypothetical protein
MGEIRDYVWVGCTHSAEIGDGSQGWDLVRRRGRLLGVTSLELRQSSGEILDESYEVDDRDVTAALFCLDGSDVTVLSLTAASGAWLGVTGGPEWYFVGFTDPVGTILQAVGAEADRPDLEVVIGAQRTVLHGGSLIGREHALDAVLNFVHEGGCSAAIGWTAV